MASFQSRWVSHSLSEGDGRKEFLPGEMQRDHAYDGNNDRKVQSDLETKNRDFSLEKPYLRQYFDYVLNYTSTVPEANIKGGGGGGYLFGKIYFSNLNEHKHIYEQGRHGQYVDDGCDLLTTVSGRDHVIRSCDYVIGLVDLLFYDSNGTLCDFFKQKFYDMEDNDNTKGELDEYEGKGKFIRITNCKGNLYKNGMFKDDKFGGLVFSQFTHEHIFNIPKRYKLSSKDNKCSYAFFNRAVQAHVAVILKDDDSEFSVYGLVAARIGMIREDDYEIILYLKEDLSRSIPVVTGQPIQLSRSLVAVPINSKLLVRAHLKTKDKHFPSAKLIFPAQQSGISELPINDEMQVKVTWEHFV